MSSDGTKVIAVGDTYLWTSTDSGATWTQQTNAGQRPWFGVASSADGTILLAGVYNNGYLYSSVNSGVTWTQETNAGVRNWYQVRLSQGGDRAISTGYGGYLYTGQLQWNT